MVKALFAVTGFDTQSDGTWRPFLQIWQGPNNGFNVTPDVFFNENTLATTVNATCHAFVEQYIQYTWGVQFNPLFDRVRMLNPVSLV